MREPTTPWHRSGRRSRVGDAGTPRSAAKIEPVRRTHHRIPRPALRPAIVTTLVLGGVALGCGSDEGGDAGRFCGEVQANRAALTSPRLEFADDVEAYLELYRSIGDLAPLAIEAEWDQLTTNYETVSTMVAGDPESEQMAIASALQTEASAAAVATWLRDNCAVEIGPLGTLVARDG